MLEDICAARATQVPRQYFHTYEDALTELHIFCDASEKAHGAAAYLKHNHSLSLVMAKSRVAPVKEITLPRLELMATLIGTRIARFITTSVQSTSLCVNKTVLWTDSMINTVADKIGESRVYLDCSE